MNPNPLTIGRVARLAGVNVETIRYYQRRGLIEEPTKPFSGFRHYPLETVARLRFIKRAQRLGFSLGEIADLLRLGDGHCEDVATLAQRKCAEIEAQIVDLRAMKGALQRLIAACRAGSGHVRCPIVESLANPNVHSLSTEPPGRPLRRQP